ncbi:hypothetical protein DTO027I6_9524 [Penicillium roqueforti]|nr:hypothetical protein CBS147337_7198 [Penicillium roqueforti]KAI2728880.1 hypothetical protein CBS147354_2127 [Penicillium roqueforti]KAI3108733.1 hypothetical protein CBS147333_6011 [Penicillium roqueforti]KAI3124896.1 hypothetical protein CBS147326_7885 [Penicillium roqueforti]KAI3186315.1 hypothetical protein DTO027I6_9524 [Penicillium roqueforti]
MSWTSSLPRSAFLSYVPLHQGLSIPFVAVSHSPTSSILAAFHRLSGHYIVATLGYSPADHNRLLKMDQEEAPPPPYSAVDPLLAPASSRNNSSSQAPIVPGAIVSPTQDASSSRVPIQPTVVPTHFRSAAAYFEERLPSVLDESRDLLQHHMTIYPRSQAKDFPRRPRCWASRLDEVTQQDWDTFLKYLFPPQLGLAASSQHLPRQLRAEIRRDRKDRPQETDEQRKARIAAVVAEWNECFFELRATQIVFVYVGEPDSAPSSALCPRCYPAATGSIDGQPIRNSNAPSPVPGQHVPSPTPWSMPPSMFHNPQVYVPPSPYGVYGVPPYPPPISPNQPPQYYTHPPQGPWQWNNWNYTQQQPQYPNNGTPKAGSGGWISQIASQAQKYGERFSEQALQYGRQVEEQAIAHGRWIEEQARLHSRKALMAGPPYGGGYYPRPAWDNSPRPIANIPLTPIQSPSPVTSPNPTGRPETIDQIDSNKPKPSTEQLRVEPPATEHTRRVSVSSVSSESSFSSIDSISTTSDLGASDLATVRTQLELLDDRHDRVLYDAAVDLRRQLSVLQESRREAKFSGNNWRAGFSQSQQNSQQSGDANWGRWDSPEQQQRNSADRRAMKEEMRATKKAFRDTLRRARDEQRERKRTRRRQVRQARANDSDTANHMPSQPLDQQLGTLRLEDSRQFNPPMPPRPVTTQAQPSPVSTPNSSNVGFGFASNSLSPAISRLSMQESAPTGDSGAFVKKGKPGDTSSRLKDMLLPRKARKQQPKDEDTGSK